MFNNSDEYQVWRDDKLANTVKRVEECMVEVVNPYTLTDAEKDKIQQLCRTNNFALFEIAPQTDCVEAIVQFNQQFGLTNQDQHLYVQNDGLAHITQSDKQGQTDFIPYTDKAIGWHTDGYYNTIENRIRAFSLFCVSPVNSGGVNQWIDPQIVYLLLREENVDIIKALTHPQAMTIPAHIVDGITRREISTGPIFFIDEKTNALSMRYTQRKQYVEFLDSTEVKQAVTLLDDLLKSHTSYHFEYAMKANQGIICNNVLHNRSAFIDDPKNPRLLLRGRYGNRI